MPISDSGLGYVPPPDEIITNPDGSVNAASVRALQETVERLIINYNGGVSFGDAATYSKAGNLNANYVTVTSGAANAEIPIKHELGRIPVGYDVVSRDKAAIVYDSRRGSWTDSTMFLKCSVATVTMRLRIY